MLEKSNSFGQFWQERKQLKIVSVIVVYASSSLVIPELAPINAEHIFYRILQLPANLKMQWNKYQREYSYSQMTLSANSKH